ncbi:hypothetical protein BST27_28460 [Mycobacterium intermedium]|uniref:DUF4189 domain-containing protein n=1 Tax=Mycobacterium intermedium TaxID=28445 RepID=A0A1E3S908_MYCIE|nr:DUF4189 domain-containing protein [Mycobacterium intermedium]MCV6965335.1 DUF4189 domain-containing protein [Mycobacterium intermedium]ODQ98112.1 hypothetical protein BHQ20_23450 [Mycobacterium intermedium]OPE47063.1 hypothetical protein BV508_23535 [Mycobacterium intermedium]ORA93833.1 hypothetical protein BST27_28460 [Mycobacterium intermedium]
MTTMSTRRARRASARLVQLARPVFAAAVAAVAAITVTLAPAAQAADSHGAIAYSSDGSWGRSKGYPTKAAAEATAVKSCGHSDCKVVVSFTACGAVAKNDRETQGAEGPDLSSAMKSALAKVPGGYIDVWECN